MTVTLVAQTQNVISDASAPKINEDQLELSQITMPRSGVTTLQEYETKHTETVATARQLIETPAPGVGVPAIPTLTRDLVVAGGGLSMLGLLVAMGAAVSQFKPLVYQSEKEANIAYKSFIIASAVGAVAGAVGTAAAVLGTGVPMSVTGYLALFTALTSTLLYVGIKFKQPRYALAKSSSDNVG